MDKRQAIEDGARDTEAKLAKLNMDAHEARKLRARNHALKAIRAAIEADEADFQNMSRVAAAGPGV